MHRPTTSLRLALLGSLGAVGLAAWAAPTVAQACSCGPYVAIHAPLPGQPMPANALMVTSAFCGGEPSQVHATIDGQPASLVPDMDRMAGLGHRLEPEPLPGAVVELVACPGWASCEEALEQTGQTDPFGMIDLSFTAVERDEQAPAPPVVHDLGYVVEDVESDDCSGEVAPGRRWSFTVDGQAGEAPLVYHMSVGPRGSSEPTWSWQVVMDGDEDVGTSLVRFEEDAGEEVCVTVRTFDVAGNEAEAVRSCQELGRRETLDGEGCACTSGGGRRGWAGAMMLLVVGAAFRQRRRS